MHERPTRPTPLPSGPELRLVAHQALGGALPGLTLLAVRNCAVRLLRHAPDGAPDTVLGATIDARDDAVIARAEAVVAPSSGRRRSATLVLGVNRVGDEICLLDESDHGRGVVETTEPRGWLVDACRRAVGRATARQVPPEVHLPLALWLDQIMVRLVHGACPLSWEHAVSLCPMADASPPLPLSTPAQVGGHLASATPTWRTQRLAASTGVPGLVVVAPDVAAWMDDAMFARWCLGFFPDLADLRDDIEFLAAEPLAAAIAQAIETALTHVAPT